MRIAMVLGRSTGGIGTHVVELVAGLRAAGDEVIVVTDEITAQRFGITDAQQWWPSRSAGLTGSARHLRRLRALAESVDVVHAHGHQAGAVCAMAMTGLKTPLVVSLHNAVLVGGARRRLLDRMQALVARRADVVTGASSDLVDTAAAFGARSPQLAPVPSPRVTALLAAPKTKRKKRPELARELLRSNGIDVPDGADLVLTIARIAPQKDLATLVDAAAAYGSSSKAPPAVWVVVGGGEPDLQAALEEQVRATGARVHFVGPQPDPERWLAAASVFVLTSTWEARALVVQEALAAGVPTVATNSGGLPDLLKGVGTLVPAGDHTTFARAVLHYLSEPHRWRTAAKAGRERAAMWDDGDATARRWRQVYASLRQ